MLELILRLTDFNLFEAAVSVDDALVLFVFTVDVFFDPDLFILLFFFELKSLVVIYCGSIGSLSPGL